MKTESLERYRRQLLQIQSRVDRDAQYVAEAIADTTSPSESANAPTSQFEESTDGMIEADLGVLATEQSLRGEIDLALAKLDSGEFGRCEACDQPIAAARLQEMPYARYCIECARERDSHSGFSQS